MNVTTVILVAILTTITLATPVPKALGSFDLNLQGRDYSLYAISVCIANIANTYPLRNFRAVTRHRMDVVLPTTLS